MRWMLPIQARPLPHSSAAVSPTYGPKHTFSDARPAFSCAREFASFCRSSDSFVWYFSASLRRTFSMYTEHEASSNCLNSLRDKQKSQWEFEQLSRVLILWQASFVRVWDFFSRACSKTNALWNITLKHCLCVMALNVRACRCMLQVQHFYSVPLLLHTKLNLLGQRTWLLKCTHKLIQLPAQRPNWQDHTSINIDVLWAVKK